MPITLENTVSESGDGYLIIPNFPIKGIIDITGYIDDVVGETSNSFFKKEFRFSLDGVNYSEWRSLTNEEVSKVEVSRYDLFLIEYKYTKNGEGPSPVSFNSIILEGDYTAIECGLAYSNSVFAKFFSCNSKRVLYWALNVLRKIYYQNIAPRYIERNQDFISLFFSSTVFFSYLVQYIRTFRDFNENEELLRKVLEDKRLILSNEETKEDLELIAKNSFRTLMYEGTFHDLKSNLNKHLRSESEAEPILSELPSVCWKASGITPQFLGTDFSGLNTAEKPIKNYQYTIPPEIQSGNSAENVILHCSTPGITYGLLGSLADAVKLDHLIDHEVLFKLKKIFGFSESFLSCGVKGYDKDDSPTQLISLKEKSYSDFSFQNRSCTNSQEEFWIRLILRGSNNGSSKDYDQLKQGFGYPLVMTNEVAKVSPILKVRSDQNITTGIELMEVVLRPLKRDSGIGHVNAAGRYEIWSRDLSKKREEEILERRLLPPFSSLKKNYEQP